VTTLSPIFSPFRLARIPAGTLAATVVLAAALGWGGLAPVAAQDAQGSTPEPRHGVAMLGEPALGPDFERFPYAAPEGAGGGRMAIALQGTYDSLNPYIVLGVAPDAGPKYVWESLMARSLDEPFTLYGLVARAIRMPEDRSYAIFDRDPRETFSDGETLTAEDVKFSFEMLRDKGKP
jgi:peptide/nickel transport system substrate-binding protein